MNTVQCWDNLFEPSVRLSRSTGSSIWSISSPKSSWARQCMKSMQKSTLELRAIFMIWSSFQGPYLKRDKRFATRKHFSLVHSLSKSGVMRVLDLGSASQLKCNKMREGLLPLESRNILSHFPSTTHSDTEQQTCITYTFISLNRPIVGEKIRAPNP